MTGVLLNKLGKPRIDKNKEILAPSGVPFRVIENARKGWYQPRYDDEVEQIAPDFNKLPQHILDNLEKAGKADFSHSSPFMNTGQGWGAVEGVMAYDGPALTAAAEAIMIDDFLLALPRQTPPVGVSYELVLHGELSMAVTTPGNFIHRLRYGGVAGVVLATSDTIAPTGTQVITKVGFELIYHVTIRTVPSRTTATMWAQGRWDCPGTLETTPASTTILVTHLKARMIPSNTPAVSGSVDVSTSKALSPTYQPSLTTASLTTHIGIVTAFN